MTTSPSTQASPSRQGRRAASEAPADTIAVSAEGLRCAYGSFEAVRGIDLSIRNGEFFALLGTNGAGKTTTMEALEGHRRASSGSVSVLGGDPYSDRASIRPRLGIMLQEAGFADDLTVEETCRLWLRLSSAHPRTGSQAEVIASGLEVLDLAAKATTRVKMLSGGQRRRLDLLLATANEPDLLFLDEPTTGLDPESRERTWELVRGLNDAGTTVVLTTHYLEEAESYADRLAIMHDGRIAVEGTLPEVLRREPSVISFEVDASVDVLQLGGVGLSPDFTPTPAMTRVTVPSLDLQQDLWRVLSWAEGDGVRLDRLSASEASLAAVFRRVSLGDTA
ncbi:ABC transporter ATP-binding protein [Arthrobacter sp. SX1312]|uniref:ABC transporter ATP-binding protein n=1 Tax=Arthrobacter sp. SX1312 TaxID=2058896 RepID=UPI000CE4B0B3|nr:ABC transporter ATP-binding protein [Arthrobacter sp. SX1312]